MANIEQDPSLELIEEPADQAPADEPERLESTPPEDAAPVQHKSVLREYFESIVVTFIMALFGMTFITQAVKVPTGSMLNTILVEDHLMVNKFMLSPHPSWLDNILPYREIRRGDIIVFKYPKNPEENYVKRVIGLPGDKIEVRGTRVFINGEQLAENKYIVRPGDDFNGKADLIPIGPERVEDGAKWTVYYTQATDFEDAARREEEKRPTFTKSFHVGDRGQFGVDEPFVVPEDSYFCMGDNRDNSEDSRFWGTVPRDNVVGRAMFVYWSINEAERERAYDDGEQSNFLTDMVRYTRWNRTGTLIK